MTLQLLSIIPAILDHSNQSFGNLFATGLPKNDSIIHLLVFFYSLMGVKLKCCRTVASASDSPASHLGCWPSVCTTNSLRDAKNNFYKVGREVKKKKKQLSEIFQVQTSIFLSTRHLVKHLLAARVGCVQGFKWCQTYAKSCWPLVPDPITGTSTWSGFWASNRFVTDFHQRSSSKKRKKKKRVLQLCSGWD